MRAFRNLADADLELPAAGLVLVGPNGHGKTSLLEALLYLEVFRSFRGARDRDLVRFGDDGFRVEVETDGGAVAAGYDARTKEKRVTVGGAPVHRMADALGGVRGVVLSPSDVELATGGAAVRRGFMDLLLALVAPGYVAALAEYRRALRQRCRATEDDVADWEALLARSGARIAAARRAWAERWAPRYREYCAEIGETVEAGLCHASRGTGDEAELVRSLERSRARDLARGTTSVGPHRDDLRLLLGGRDLGVYGSAGQWRTAALALRLVAAETLAARGASEGSGGDGGGGGGGGDPPVVCLDDAFAELDAERSARLGRLVEALAARGSQVFATVPREGELPGAVSGLVRWRIRDGRIGGGAA